MSNAYKKDTSYNGWTNYETWNVKLWLDNDEGTLEHVYDLKIDAGKRATEQNEKPQLSITQDLAEMIKDYVEELNPISGDASMFTDLLGSALSAVNWAEIAEHYLDN